MNTSRLLPCILVLCGKGPLSSTLLSQYTHILARGLDDLSVYVHTERKDLGLWRTRLRLEDMPGLRWAHASTQSAIAGMKMGPAGMGTYLTPAINSILVCILAKPVTTDNMDKLLKASMDGRFVMDAVDGEYALFRVERGSEL